ncbi:amidohydrolase [Salinicoccus sp. ID82-1]|uniref:Amidohydrolase n=1 Tax=Salinicoccus cyprini TaxID=2493691 RepID=A0A558AST1_9STAP|nr:MULTISPECIES: M20 family metallopeptidase [Salinicoccus]MCG1009813.1 amidohydrolase [Salinicoccus sp. ID82-1]TVT27319.1 amidohydrolase [Salinicoccus cyprini]
MTVKDRAIDNHLEHVINFRRRLHKAPELSFKEYETTKLVAHGLEDTDIEFYELSEDTGLIGVLEKDPSYEYIGVRADMDALPITEENDLDFKSENEGVMHACGHDIHTSIIYGFAKVINELYEDLKYNLVFIFQPAEETLEGAKYINDELKRLEIPVDKMIMFHTWPTLEEGLIGYREEDMMAGSITFDVKLTAKGGHAAHPDTTADPIYLASNIIQFIQGIASRFNDPATPVVITVGQIHAGEKNNVIPDALHFGGSIRSFSEKSIDMAKRMLGEYTDDLMKMSDADCNIEYSRYCPPVINNKELVNDFINSGEDVKFHELKEPSMGSEDFAFYMQDYIGAAFRVGTKIKGEEKSTYSLHSPEVIFSEKSIETAIRSLVNFTTKAH